MIIRYDTHFGDEGAFGIIYNEEYAKYYAERYPNAIVFFAELAPMEV